jgi:hypothetical protein
LALLLAVGGPVVASTGCFSEAGQVGCEDGAEGCACFANASCLSELVCVDGTCVAPGDGTGGPTGTSDAATTLVSTDDGTGMVSASESSGDSTGGSGDSTGEECLGEMSVVATLIADTNIAVDSPDINYGAQPLSNLGTGRGLLRFVLPMPAADALAQGSVTRMSLTLTRVPNHPACGGECPATSGHLTAYPLRNDWEEGTNDGNDPGATWHRRYLANQEWEADGASAAGIDRGGLAASVAVDEVDASVVLSLDPGEYTSDWIIDRRISVIVEAGNGAMFVAATRENAVLDEPILEVRFCS